MQFGLDRRLTTYTIRVRQPTGKCLQTVESLKITVKLFSIDVLNTFFHRNMQSTGCSTEINKDLLNRKIESTVLIEIAFVIKNIGATFLIDSF